jgi:hypothetical protein
MKRALQVLFMLSLGCIPPISSTVRAQGPLSNMDALIEEALHQNPGISASKEEWNAYEEGVPQWIGAAKII